MTTPITPMSAEEISENLEDLQFNTAVMFGTPFIPDEDWLRLVLASHLAYVKEKMLTDNPAFTCDKCHGLEVVHEIIQAEIDELTK